MNERNLGVVERTKKFGKEMGLSAMEVGLGLVLTGGAFWPTVAGLIFIYRGVGRAGRAAGVA